MMDHGWARALSWGIEAGRFGFVLLDPEGRILHANEPVHELLGGQHVAGRALTELLHPDDRGWSEAELMLLFAGAIVRIRQQVRLLCADGSGAWIELNVRRVDDAPDSSLVAVAMLEDAGDRGRWERELRRLADSDPLTDLFNRRRFEVELERHLAFTHRYGPNGALLLLDVDRLKAINDTYGHLAGDRTIIAVARLLRSRARASDVIARLGGDEFAVLLPAASEQESVAVAEALLDALRADPVENVPEAFTASVGIAIVTVGSTAEALLQRADVAMYQVKRAGGNDYAVEVQVLDSLLSPEPSDDAHAPSPWASRVLQAVPDPLLPEVAERTLLQTVAELGGASIGLAAWELYTDEQAIAPLWTNAIRDGLLERVGYEPIDQEWRYGLTRPGRRRLGELERELAEQTTERSGAAGSPRRRSRRVSRGSAMPEE
jgi:diguanylate cyclase (GGDEF)-like protein/PAS domain S-box-containing protein